MDQRFWAQAYEILVDVMDQLGRLGIESAYVQWLASVVTDSTGLLSEAVVHIVRARALDPIFSRAIASEKTILDRVVALIDIAGAEDAQALAVVSIVRRHYPLGHVAVQRIGEKIAEKTAAEASTYLVPPEAQA